MDDEIDKARIEGAMFAVNFVLSHYELHKSGYSVFTPLPVNPEKWWAEMQILPHNPARLRLQSRAHFEARKERWQELVKDALRQDEGGE